MNDQGMARKPDAQAIKLTLPAELLKRIDKAGRGSTVSRAETVRRLLGLGLDQIEGPPR